MPNYSAPMLQRPNLDIQDPRKTIGAPPSTADVSITTPQSAAPPGLTAPPSRPVPTSSDSDLSTRPVASTQPNGGVGAMVNGVQTFNDATVPKIFIDRAAAAVPSPSGVASTLTRPTPSATFNGRTYSGEELDKLAASVNTVPAASFTRPGVGTLGTPVSPEQGAAMAALNIPRPVAQAPQSDTISRPMDVQRPTASVPQFGVDDPRGQVGAPDMSSTIQRPTALVRPSLYDPTETASRYQSNLADIINKDPRSLSGTAAHNLEADAIWARNTARTPSERRQAAADYQQTKAALLGSPKGIFDAGNQAGLANARDQTQWADNTNSNAANITRAGLMSDSRLGAAAERADAMNYGADARADALRYAADTRGNAQVNAATINANRPRTNAAFEHGSAMAYANGYTQAIQNGMSPDQAIDYAQKNRAAFEQRNDLQKQNQLSGASSQQSSAGGVSSQQAIPQGAIDRLKKNPHKYADFDAMFGPGTAAQYLGPSGG